MGRPLGRRAHDGAARAAGGDGVLELLRIALGFSLPILPDASRELAWLRGRDLPRVAEKIEKLHSEISSLLGMDLDQFE